MIRAKLASIVFIFLLLSSYSFVNPTYAESKIPDWVRQIFIWYGQEQISEDDVLNALQYLIEQKIIDVSNQNTPTKIADKGNLKVVYKPTNDPYFAELIPWLKENQDWVINDVVINEGYAFPHDVFVVFDECGEINAFYVPDLKEIVMCYELVQYFINLFEPMSQNDEELTYQVQDALFFVFLHEFGHGLVDMYDLPITGSEEDAVDQFSSYVLFFEGQQGVDALVSVANWFLHEGNIETETENLAFWDVHSFNLQRYYDIVCLIYGGNPEDNQFLVDEGYLTPERADYCPSEYERVIYSWDVLLTPHLKVSN